MVILCFCSGRPKSLGDYLKEKVSLFILKISCNYKAIYSFTISFRVRKGAAEEAG